MLALNAKLSRRGKDRTGCIDDTAVAGNKGALWMFAYTANTGLDSVRQQPIIGIEENKELTATMPQPRIASGGKAGIFLVDIAYRRIGPNDFGCVVSGAIIHYDNLEVRITLCQNALDRLLNKMGVVVTWDHYRHPAR
jgi:hypothetical protein